MDDWFEGVCNARPGSRVRKIRVKGAGHFLQEDKGHELAENIILWLRSPEAELETIGEAIAPPMNLDSKKEH